MVWPFVEPGGDPGCRDCRGEAVGVKAVEVTITGPSIDSSSSTVTRGDPDGGIGSGRGGRGRTGITGECSSS